MKRAGPRSTQMFHESDDDLFTAPEVAKFCKVDLKTIHNWVEREEMAHFRTPGRHLRFRRADLLDFFTRFNYPVPPDLRKKRPLVYILDPDTQSAGGMKRSLGAIADCESCGDLLDLMVKIGKRPPNVVVVDSDLPDEPVRSILAALARDPDTQGCKVIAYGSNEPDGAGSFAFVHKPAVRDVRAALEGLFSA